MLRIIHSIPQRCPDCGSEDIRGRQGVNYEWGNTLVCVGCGIIMVLQEVDDGEEEVDSDFEVSASLFSCPHCHTISDIQEAEGKEWCSGCGLDPDRTNYPVEELSHLWRRDSGIRRFMDGGTPSNNMTRMYRFLTNFCGPHCAYEQACPQATGNFVRCLHEEDDNTELLQIEGDIVGKGKGKGKKSRKERKKEKERILREKGRAVLVCSDSGWYNKRYSNETNDPQKSGSTGSGSGA